MRPLLILLATLQVTLATPTLWIIGDSTVRNSTRGQQGWGDPLIELFQPDQIKVINKAIGGRSSRSFLTQGRWDEILTELKKGDYVLIQFGHNDGGRMFEGDRPRASIKGNGDESETGTVEATGKEETVRSFGWYLRHYCQTAQEKGATPIVCSLIPRNIRDANGTIQADTKTYAHWAELAARQTGSHFIPLNQLLCDRYNALPKALVDAIFCGTDHTHSSYPGAAFNSRVVADGIRDLKSCDLARHLRSSPSTLTLPDKQVPLTRTKIHTPETGYGWLDYSGRTFAADLPEGNYRVTATYGTPEAAANAWVKSEARRLMVTPRPVSDDRSREFTVNIRTPGIAGEQEIKLRRSSDRFSPDWDQRLSLEFFPDSSALVSLKITPAPDPVTIYLAGDSTVTNQSSKPWAGWGQMLPAFFQPEVAIANHAESGRALFSFRGERRLEKILSTIRPGDYLFIQFGHNDQKDKRGGAGAFTTYSKDLESYIEAARQKQAHPVLITPMERRRWNDGKPQETLADYAAAVRQVGGEQKVPVIDLHAMSLELYGALGPEGSRKAFVHYPANTFPGQREALKDDTHHSNYGAHQLARCIVQGIRDQVPELAAHLWSPDATFAPATPDPADTLTLPASPGLGETPEGE